VNGALSGFEIGFLVFYSLLLVLLSVYGGHRYWLAYLYYKHKKDVKTPKGKWDELPHVTIQLPIFNEMFVVERLVDATCTIRYPAEKFEIQVLDDSTDETVDVARAVVENWKAKGVDIVHIHRTNREGFKAGALEAGLHVAKGEFIAVFDADFVPQPNFLERTIDFFTSDEVGMVQVRWDHLNRDFSLLTRAQAVLLDGHFVIEHTARNRSGRFFNFNGTAGIWRRQTIHDAGGWQHDTLTEDLDLSYRAQIEGWKFVFLPDVLSPAEVPVEMNSFKSQQHRWAKGSIQTAKKLLPRIIRSKDLPFRVKCESVFHLTNNLAYLFMVVLCVAMPASIVIRSGVQLPGLWFLDLTVLLLATVSVGFFYYACQREAGIKLWERIKYVPVVLSIGIGLCINNARAVIEALIGQESGFTRTPKYGVVKRGDRAWQKQIKYHRKKNWLPLVEVALGGWFTYAIYTAISCGAWMAVPFLLLFQFGFLYMGLMSLIQTKTGIGRLN
jgi:cellulose synthase/poly-beta-1,6-N-acetylglucosamine synthase-like glycosyltransferase